MLGVIEFAQGLLFLLLKLGDACRFLKDHAAFRRLALDDVRDLALGHDAVAVPPDAGAHEQLLDIAQSAGGAVQKIFTAAIAEYASSYGDFGKAQVHPGGLEVLFIHITERNRDFSHTGGFTASGAFSATENDVSHFATTQCLGGLFTQDPSYSIGDIGFAASIGSNHGGNARFEIQGGFIRKRLKSNGLQAFEIHSILLMSAEMRARR